ncbi:MAG TPA: hypothetical protein VG123_31230 [Streptosporangiaceae bacterium]|jgi:hypothetical protein|nr:hypothetical protein [Streptosporangiaceae bacterium]
MDGRYVVAEGTHGDELTWVIWAKRDEPEDGDLFSMIRVSDADGRVLHGGGRTGPPLHPGHVLNVTAGGGDEGPRALLARVDPKVRRLELKLADGTASEVPLYDCPDIPEVRFASLLLPREVALESVAGFGAKDEELERFDLRFYQGRWEERHWREFR